MLEKMNLEINIIKIKRNERWVIYAKNVEATKITSDWYLWMHHTIDKIPNIIKKNILGKKNIQKIKLVLKIVINQKIKKNIKKKYETWK